MYNVLQQFSLVKASCSISHYSWVFLHDITAATLVSQNNLKEATLMSLTNPMGVESLFLNVNTFFCLKKFAWLMARWVRTLYTILYKIAHFTVFTQKWNLSKTLQISFLSKIHVPRYLTPVFHWTLHEMKGIENYANYLINWIPINFMSFQWKLIVK